MTGSFGAPAPPRIKTTITPTAFTTTSTSTTSTSTSTTITTASVTTAKSSTAFTLNTEVEDLTTIYPDHSIQDGLEINDSSNVEENYIENKKKAEFSVTAAINKIVSSTGKISIEGENEKNNFTTDEEMTTEMIIVAEDNIDNQSDENVATFLLPNDVDIEVSSVKKDNQAEEIVKKSENEEIDVESVDENDVDDAIDSNILEDLEASPSETHKSQKVYQKSSQDPLVYIPGEERKSLIAYLGNIDLSGVEISELKATPREKLAVAQELEIQRLGLPAFTDPTPWQRLTRSQQIEFNEKFLALPSELQSFSRKQFLTLSEAKQMRAYNAFLALDTSSLEEIIRREMEKVLQQELDLIENNSLNLFVKENPRSQNGIRIENFEFNPSLNNEISKESKDRASHTKSKYDPRRRQFKPKALKQRQFPAAKQQHMRNAEKLHFQFAKAQLQQAIKLQACLANHLACNF